MMDKIVLPPFDFKPEDIIDIEPTKEDQERLATFIQGCESQSCQQQPE